MSLADKQGFVRLSAHRNPKTRRLLQASFACIAMQQLRSFDLDLQSRSTAQTQSLWFYINICIYIYICLSLSLSLSLDIYIYVCIYIHRYTYTYKCILRYVHIGCHVIMYVCTHGKCVCMHACMCVHRCTHLLYMHIHITGPHFVHLDESARAPLQETWPAARR